eukprot:4715903-Amphidinium_carterae.1
MTTRTLHCVRRKAIVLMPLSAEDTWDFLIHEGTTRMDLDFICHALNEKLNSGGTELEPLGATDRLHMSMSKWALGGMWAGRPDSAVFSFAAHERVPTRAVHQIGRLVGANRWPTFYSEASRAQPILVPSKCGYRGACADGSARSFGDGKIPGTAATRSD